MKKSHLYNVVILPLPEEKSADAFLSYIEYEIVTKSDFTLTESEVGQDIMSRYLWIHESLSIGSVAVMYYGTTSDNDYNIHQTSTVILARRSPDSCNRLEIIRNIILKSESYKTTNTSLKNNHPLCRILTISSQVNQETLGKGELQPFFEDCRRSWYGDLDEGAHQFVPNIDIIEKIVKKIVN